MMRRLRLAVLVVAATAAGIGLSAQQVTFKASSDMVPVYATVRDGGGRLVTGLSRDDFEVREDGKVRDIALFSNDVQPITLAMIVDRSGSLTSKAAEVSAAATAFFDTLLPGDRVSLGSLTWDCVPLTSDLERLRKAVNEQINVDWASPVWASINRAFLAIETEPGPRAVLIFSDGDDRDHPSGQREWNSCHGAPVSTRASRREVGVEVNGTRKDAELRSMARNTGGELYRMKDGETLTPVFTRIAEELHSQYLLGFVPTVLDGKSARIDVRAKRPGLDVRARRSFAVARRRP